MLELYTSPTPNGWKASIMLEELELDYTVHTINLMAGDQKKPEYLALNPNGRIPTLVDDGFAVFESGAILLYLADKYQKFLPTEAKARSQVIQWLMFQMGGIGPMMGQANVFFRYWDEKIPAVIERYQNEGRRLFEVVERQLENREFICGELSIADMALWPWMRTHVWSGINTDGLDNVTAWLSRCNARPAFRKGAEVPIKIDAEVLLKAAQNMVAK